MTLSPSITVVVTKGITANICWLCKFDWSDHHSVNALAYTIITVVLISAIPVFAQCLNQPQHWSFILLVSFLVSFPDSMIMGWSHSQTIFFWGWNEAGQVQQLSLQDSSICLLVATQPLLLTHLREKVVQICGYNHMFSLAAMEFPQINYRAYNGKKYSFVYGVSSGDFLLNTLVRFSCR